MAMHPKEVMDNSLQRVVLVDFDWEDADLLPEILRSPGMTVRLVAGVHAEDAGVRVAELCGLPRTVELSDLTREIFDLALVGERSSRRVQIERLFRTLGTPTQSPGEFLRGGVHIPERAPEGPVPHAADGPARDSPAPREAFDAPSHPSALLAHSGIPPLADAAGLERLLSAWCREHHATAGTLHVARGGKLQRVCHTGTEDGLLVALVTLAHQSGAPQVIARVGGAQRERVWGAWPVRTAEHEAILAVADADGDAAAGWAGHAESLRSAWEVGRTGDAEQAGPAALPVDAFLHRLEMAVDRNRTEGYRFALHRVRFDGAAELDRLIDILPGQLRGSDSLCRHGAKEILLMCAGSANAYVQVRRRIVSLWERAWRESGRAHPAPPIADERVEMSDPEDARSFLSAAHAWLAGA